MIMYSIIPADLNKVPAIVGGATLGISLLASFGLVVIVIVVRVKYRRVKAEIR